MTTDPWQHMLLAIEPAYFTYKDIMDRDTQFRVDISQLSNRSYQIHITEEWYLDSEQNNIVINWTTEQLSTWPDCRRISWDMWEFKRRKDAEKFKTLFILKWAQ
jgi:hypothetical protein